MTSQALFQAFGPFNRSPLPLCPFPSWPQFAPNVPGLLGPLMLESHKLEFVFCLVDYSLIIIGKESYFIDSFCEQFMFSCTNDIHLSIFFFSGEKASLVILKMDWFWNDGFLYPLHRFSSSPSFLEAYNFARSPQNSKMISPPHSSLNMPGTFLFILRIPEEWFCGKFEVSNLSRTSSLMSL